MTFFQELKRRNVFKVAASYAIVAWIMLQVADTTFPALNIPAWVLSLLTVLVLLGFPLALFLAWAYEMTPDGVKPTAEVPVATSIRAQTGHKMNYLVIGGMAVLLVVVVLDAYVFNQAPEAQAETAQAAVPVDASTAAAPDAVADGGKSLAILPFSNLSSDQEQDYFADGLTEELINTLAGVDGLLVTGRTSSFYFKNSTESLDAIAGALGVANILQGSVRKAGTELRITVQLTEIDTGFTLWSQSFDRQLDDIFMIQEEIATAVSTALSVTLGVGDFARPGMTRNVDAYDAFLQARPGVVFQGGSLLDALVHAEAAVALDPEFALGWQLLGEIYGSARTFLSSDQTAGFEEKRAEALATAARLAPEMLESELGRYLQLRSEFRQVEAEQLLQQLGDRYGQDPALTLAYGRFLLQMGRVQESRVMLERAARQDPLSGLIAVYLAMTLLAAKAPEEVIRREIARGLALGEFQVLMNNNLAVLELQHQNWDAARAAWGNDAITYLREGKTQEGLEYLRGVLTVETLAPLARERNIPLFAALLGDPQLALDVMNSADVIAQEILWHEHFSAMRRLPGFKTLVEEQGLVAYWRATGKWADYCRPVNDDFECF